MKPTKLKADFRRKKIPDLLVLAETVLAAYPNHPAVQGTRPDFLPSDEGLKQSIESLRGSYAAALKGDRDKMKLRENDHDILIGHLTTLAHYYETAAGQNPQLLANTGFTQAPAGRSTYRGPLQAPSALQLKHGPNPGTIIAKVARVQNARSYELQFTDGDPTIESNWRLQGMHFKCSEMAVTGLEGGKVYSFRVRAIGPSGGSPWSPPGTLRAM